MKKYILLFTLFLFISCSTNTQQESTDTQQEEKGFDQTYFLFTINTQDWVYPEESVETMNKIIDIHEKYNVPVDIYLDDQIFQYYAYNAPELIERFKNSEMVAISYHVRAPHPTDIDYWKLDEKTEDELYAFLLPYEEYKLESETGEINMSLAGGYQFIKDTIGYAPFIVPMKSDSERVDEVMARIYKEKGATWTLVHGRNIKLGETKYGLYIRPEDQEIKYYEYYEEYKEGTSAEEIILTLIQDNNIQAGDFVNLKMHENNFIEGPGTAAYWEIYGKDKKPPFDLSKAYTVPVLPEEEREIIFQMYEDAVKYISEHPEEYITINAKDLDALIETSKI